MKFEPDRGRSWFVWTLQRLKCSAVCCRLIILLSDVDPPHSRVDVMGLRRLSGPLASPLGDWKLSSSSHQSCLSKPHRPPKNLRLHFPSSSLLFPVQTWRSTSHWRLFLFYSGPLHCRKCLLFNQVWMIFLIKDRKKGKLGQAFSYSSLWFFKYKLNYIYLSIMYLLFIHVHTWLAFLKIYLGQLFSSLKVVSLL